jgi:hypothetical protein
MTLEIKSCPFCGQDPRESDVGNINEYDDIIPWSVGCAYCDCEGPPGWDYVLDHKLLNDKEWCHNPTSSKEAAIFRWNERKGK